MEMGSEHPPITIVLTLTYLLVLLDQSSFWRYRPGRCILLLHQPREKTHKHDLQGKDQTN